MQKQKRPHSCTLNILVIPCTEWVDGSQQRLHHLVEKWVRTHKVHIARIERPEIYKCKERKQRSFDSQIIHKIRTVRTKNLGSFYLLNAGLQFFAFLKLIVKYKIDAVIVEGLGASSIAIIVAKFVKKPVFYEYSDYYPDFIDLYASKGIATSFFKTIGNLTNILNMMLSDATIAVSSNLSAHAKGFSDNVFKIPNGVSEEYFNRSNGKISDICHEKKTITLGFIGALESWVSLETVIDAVYTLNYVEKVNTNLIVVGDGPKLKSFIDYTKQSHVSDRIQFTGWVPYVRLYEYLSKFDVCVLPFDSGYISKYSMPMKVHEYAISKKPTISAPLPEIKTTYRDSILYASSSKEYVDYVKKIFSDKILAESLSDSAYKIALTYSWENLSKEYATVLAKISCRSYRNK